MCMLIGWPGKLCNLIGWEPGVFQFAGDLQLLLTRSPDARAGEFGCYQAKLVVSGNHTARYTSFAHPEEADTYPAPTEV